MDTLPVRMPVTPGSSPLPSPTDDYEKIIFVTTYIQTMRRKTFTADLRQLAIYSPRFRRYLNDYTRPITLELPGELPDVWHFITAATQPQPRHVLLSQMVSGSVYRWMPVLDNDTLEQLFGAMDRYDMADFGQIVMRKMEWDERKDPGTWDPSVIYAVHVLAGNTGSASSMVRRACRRILAHGVETRTVFRMLMGRYHSVTHKRARGIAVPIQEDRLAKEAAAYHAKLVAELGVRQDHFHSFSTDLLRTVLATGGFCATRRGPCKSWTDYSGNTERMHAAVAHAWFAYHVALPDKNVADGPDISCQHCYDRWSRAARDCYRRKRYYGHVLKSMKPAEKTMKTDGQFSESLDNTGALTTAVPSNPTNPQPVRLELGPRGRDCCGWKIEAR